MWPYVHADMHDVMAAMQHDCMSASTRGPASCEGTLAVLHGDYRGPKAAVIVKQALPYVRCVGESWPLSLQRAYFESEALREEHKHCSTHTPEVWSEH